MNPDDLIDKGIIRDTDLEGGPPKGEAAELGPFGRYMLLEELGRGGAGIVFRALDPLLNRELALKRLRFGDFELEARFLREAELLARLSHPGIMPVFDFGRESDSLYFTMPLATGMSLDRWIVERRPDARASALIMRQSAEALAHAHERGVLHRDVKPANIMVSAEGNAQVADFGLGRVVDPKGREAGRMTQSGEVMGTPSYMAPEFATGDLKGVDARCDVYGLGATLYEAMTGRPPFIGKSTLEILKRVTSEEPVPPRRLAPDAPADLEIICLKALEKDPARRYATAGDLADDLGRFLAGEPIHAHRASVFYRARRFVGRRRAIVAVAIAGVAVAAGIAIYAALGAEDSASRRTRATLHLAKADEHIRRVDQLMKDRSENDPEVRQQANAAFERIAQALVEDPGSAQAHFLKGKTHVHLFESDLARASFDAAVASGPLPLALLERAILDCEDVIFEQSRPESYQSLESLSSLRRRLGDDLKRVLEVTTRPSDVGFVQALQMISTDPPDGRGASALLERYTSDSPTWRAYYWKGMAELWWAQEVREESQAEVLERASVSLQSALDSRSNCRITPRLLERLGFVRFCLNDLGEAERLFREAVEREEGLPDHHYHLAITLNERKDYAGAIQEAQAAIDRGPLAPDVLGLRGVARARRHKLDPGVGRGELEKAKADLKAARDRLKAGTVPYEDVVEALKYVEDALGDSKDY